jgi:hypothetical protein
MADLPAVTSASMPSYGELRGNRDHRLWIAGAISSLLKLYWTDDPSDRLDAAAGRWWADDLQAFPQPVIEAAINHWRRTERHRPTPADMIQLCGRHMPKSRPTLVQMPEREPVTREQAAAILEANGFGQIVKRMPRGSNE